MLPEAKKRPKTELEEAEAQEEGPQANAVQAGAKRCRGGGMDGCALSCFEPGKLKVEPLGLSQSCWEGHGFP